MSENVQTTAVDNKGDKSDTIDFNNPDVHNEDVRTST
jgi:hypothetical protein